MNALSQAFDCRRCGHCCQGEGGIVLTLKDQRRLADHLGMELEPFLAAHATAKGERIHLGVREDGFCVFFRDGCGVHTARPDVCRAWPYFRGNLIDASSWEMSLEYCPGINPDVSHEEFVRQGLSSLANQNVGATGDASAPSALKLDGLVKP